MIVCLCHPAFKFNIDFEQTHIVRPLLIIVVERDYLRGTICLVPSLTAGHVSSVHVYVCTCVFSLCGREVV